MVYFTVMKNPPEQFISKLVIPTASRFMGSGNLPTKCIFMEIIRNCNSIPRDTAIEDPKISLILRKISVLLK